MTNTEAREIFRLAATKTITRTNVGGRVKVDVGHYTYTVEISPKYLAQIIYRDGFGGLEHIEVNASPAEDRALRAAMATQN